MQSISIRRASMLMIATLFAAASCTEQLHEDSQFPAEEGAVMTKVINTPSDFVEGSLVLCLSESAVEALSSGDASLVEEMSGKVNVKSLKPVFTIVPGKEDVARKHNLHKWYEVTFDGDTRTAASRLTAFADVKMVQFNKVLSPASDCSFTPYVPSLSQMASGSGMFNDTMLDDQWHLINTGSSNIANSAVAGADIAVSDAWALTAGDPRVVVAIIDGPVKYNHPDLSANMWKNTDEVAGNGKDDDNNGYVDDVYGWNCVQDNGNINWSNPAETGHGTHVAGIVAAANNNGAGVCGVAGGSGKGDGVRMMSCQIFEGGSAGATTTSAKAFVYAADNGASIAQCSFGYEGEGAAYGSDSEYAMVFGAEYDAIRYFMDPANNNSDILDANIVIAAAGNDSRNQSSYPAAVADVVSVTGLGPDGLPAVCYTNYGPGCNIAAPGGDFYIGNTSDISKNRSRVLSTFINTVTDSNLGTSGHDYVYMQGTSMACPCVSGVAALGLSYAYKLGKKFTRDEFIGMLLTSVGNLDDLLIDNKMKIAGYTNGNPRNVNLGLYRGKMGTGAIDAWKLMMAVEGTPCIIVQVGDENSKAKRYDISSYFGDSAADLSYLEVECDAATREALGLKEDPVMKYGKLSLNPTKVGSGKVTVRAIAGGENVGGSDKIGGMEIERTISILSRGVVSDNGGWL
ncbi:MAG: S8 family serine peptidase [Bacteroidales bacterium]|nr:S8 family serine peptidase [Bacteroidales bacterium]